MAMLSMTLYIGITAMLSSSVLLGWSVRQGPQKGMPVQLHQHAGPAGGGKHGARNHKVGVPQGVLEVAESPSAAVTKSDGRRRHSAVAVTDSNNAAIVGESHLSPQLGIRQASGAAMFDGSKRERGVNAASDEVESSDSLLEEIDDDAFESFEAAESFGKPKPTIKYGNLCEWEEAKNKLCLKKPGVECHMMQGGPGIYRCLKDALEPGKDCYCPQECSGQRCKDVDYSCGNGYRDFNGDGTLTPASTAQGDGKAATGKCDVWPAESS